MTRADVLERTRATGVGRARLDRAFGRATSTFVLGATVGLAAAVATLRGILASAYGADDIWASQSPAYRAVQGATLWDQWTTTTTQWMSIQGRFFPGTTADWLVVYATFTTRESYKAFQLVIALLAFGTWVFWVSRACRSAWVGLLALVVALACTQFRFFYDPFLHFAGQQSLLVVAMFGSLIVTQWFLRAERTMLLLPVGAMLLWSLALTTYESSYLVAPGALATIWLEHAPRPRKVWAALSIGAPTLVLGAVVAVLRMRMTHPSEVYSSNLDPAQLVPTLAKQLIATLPLSYTWTQHGHGIPSLSHAYHPSAPSAVLFLAVAALTAMAILRMPRRTTRELLAMGALGASLMFAAAFVTAVSRYWQQTLQLGQGYIGVFAQSLGLALLAVSAAAAFARRPGALARPARGVVAVACGLVLGWTVVATAQQNDRVVTASDPTLGSWAAQRSIGFPREVTMAAFSRGLLDGYPAADTVYGNPGGPWFNGPALSYASGHHVTVPNQWAYWTLVPGSESRLPGCVHVGPCAIPMRPVASVSVRAQSYDRGVVVLARAERIYQLGAAPTDAEVITSQARIYYSAYDRRREICATAPRPGGGAAPVPVVPTRLRVVATGAGWTIVDATFPQPGVPASSIGVRALGSSSCL